MQLLILFQVLSTNVQIITGIAATCAYSMNGTVKHAHVQIIFTWQLMARSAWVTVPQASLYARTTNAFLSGGAVIMKTTAEITRMNQILVVSWFCVLFCPEKNKYILPSGCPLYNKQNIKDDFEFKHNLNQGCYFSSDPQISRNGAIKKKKKCFC